ncbi:MAG: class I SAM-dependent methyltransferase [Helicobacteraceae bacterium]|nr:class I SAM-dependent methyltransferase [Helicobacteraceae bacterium]
MDAKMSGATTQTQRCIEDFGEQWSQYPENEGLYASVETLQDICGDLLNIGEFEGKTIADIGSGSGRIVNMLLDAGAKKVTALEPSAAFDVLRRNTSDRADRIVYLRAIGGGGELPPNSFDFALSIGVMHHIPDPAPAMREMFESLRGGGKAIVWLYGREGNGLYLFFVRPLRVLTSRMPHKVLHAFVKFIAILLNGYICLCSHVKLPMYLYMRNVVGKWSRHIRFVTIYDQLNPAYAKYYRRDEAEKLMSDAGFINVRAYHRHNYSWTMLGEKVV